MSTEVPLEIRRSILQGKIAESKAAEFSFTALARAFKDCELIPQAEAQAKNLVSQQRMTASFEKQLDELQ